MANPHARSPSPPAALPTGTVTFLFTDIEGSTRLLTSLGHGYDAVLAAHNDILRRAIGVHGGVEVGTEGDAFFAAFPSASEAISSAVSAQRSLADHAWPDGTDVRVRMGLHTGEGRLGGDDYVGIDVHRAARIAAAGHGGQVLLSEPARALVANALPDGVSLRDLGAHRLKDLPDPERIWQLDIDGLVQEFAPLRSIDARPNNLPLPAASLIGRTAELAAVADLVRANRLVTLTGPGGTGKTRLGIAVGHHVLPEFEDGAWFVGLQDAWDRPSVAAAIASALGVREKYDRELEQGAKDFMRDRQLLLVLDNFEQVVELASPLVAELLAGAPAIHVLVTSRAVLRLSGEQEWPVPPLDVPNVTHMPTLGELGRFEAIGLFVQRARAVAPGFAITDDNARSVTEICRRLDGLPLGIELAAARVKLLSPEAILDRLERHLPVLSTAARDVPARQRTLGATIDWSYDLLPPAERQLFARASVFAGGWTLEAADVVCNPGGELGLDTLDGIGALVDNSLARTGSRTAGDEDQRFETLQVIREYAADKLALEQNAVVVHRRHAEWVAWLAETARPELRGRHLRTWQLRLRREEENIRAALRWALDTGEAGLGLRIASSVWDFWHYWAEVREGIGWLESLLALPAAADVPDERARGLDALGGLVYWQGRADRAWELYEEAVAIRRMLGDDHALALALFQSAWAAAAEYDLARAAARATEAAELFRRSGDEENAGMMEAWLVIEPVIIGAGGDPSDAIRTLEDAFSKTESAGRAHDAADWLGGRAMVHRITGDPSGGLPIARSAISAWYKLGNLGRLPLALKVLAALELQSGEPYRAVRLEAAAQRLSEDVGGDLFQVFGVLGDPIEEARPLLPPDEHAQAVAEGREIGLDEQVAFALAGSDTPSRRLDQPL
jgi:predicted ATPase/class 3 adenylate cyclase